jgi:putative transposase
MKASKFSDAQKAFILKQGADGVPVADICRWAGISQATYFNWKKKYEGLAPLEMRRLKQLEDENTKLRELVADLSLDREMLQDHRPKIDPQDRFLDGLLSAEKSESWSQARARRHDVWRVAGVDPPGLCGSGVRPVHVPLPILPTRPGPLGGDPRPFSGPPEAGVSGLSHGGGLGAPPGFCNAIGGLWPMAPCGRSSL